MYKEIFFTIVILFIFLLSGISQAITDNQLKLLKYIDSEGHYYEYMKPRKQSWVKGELDCPFPIGQLDSFYYFIIDNGKRSSWTQKTVIQFDSIVKEYYDTTSQDYHTTIYSKVNGNKISSFGKNGGSEYFYNNSQLLDSLIIYGSINEFSTQYVITNENEEVWRWKRGNRFIRKNIFNEDSLLISSLYFYSDGRYDSLKTYTILNLSWNEDLLIKTDEKRYLDGQLTYFISNEYERDSLGIINNIFTKSTLNPVGSSTPIKYDITVNHKGQTQIARWWGPFKSLYTFDNHGNWISKERDYLQQYRVMFYKK